ncbi:YfiM family protein [Aliifodinibius sp. S!AR15-10]|uniref:DUF2279 domain-containing protein n=1 Tax=Aliifodinibius sp. S!AR15-10 TaxID=2950437 RepID=UPI00285C4722|nr:DUF2279 domain-containing protein [Aliifodinibius sp. S!AR15-10]MDR8394049.1 YfiM family protein [Aliifodinibius sp. S!AR15-10]
MYTIKITFIYDKKIGFTLCLLLNLFFVHLYTAFAQAGSSSTFSHNNLFLNESWTDHLVSNSYQNAIHALQTSPLQLNNVLNSGYYALAPQLTQKSEIDWNTFSAISGGLAVSYTGLFLYIEDRWWSSPKVPFHYGEHFYAKGFDKLGHFYASKTQAMAISRLYELSGLSRNKSILLGSGLALTVQTLIELKDGWITPGFDRYDQLSNLVGIGWFLARENSDFLQRFNVRWMYYPSETRYRQPAFQNRKLADYNGQSYWLSMRMWDLLPSKLQPYWPRFIQPAVGVSLNDWPSTARDPSYLSYHLSLSLDFKEIFPQKTAFGRIMGDVFNSIYLPAPAFELHPNPSFKLIFYGQD